MQPAVSDVRLGCAAVAAVAVWLDRSKSYITMCRGITISGRGRRLSLQELVHSNVSDRQGTHLGGSLLPRGGHLAPLPLLDWDCQLETQRQEQLGNGTHTAGR